MEATFYWDQKGTGKAISKAAAGLRVPHPIWGKHVRGSDRRSLAPCPRPPFSCWLIGACVRHP